MTQSGNWHFQLLNEHPVPTWLINRNNFAIRFCNKSAQNIYGDSESSNHDLIFLDLISSSCRAVVFQKINSGTSFTYSCNFLKKGNEESIVELHGSLIVIEGEEFYHLSAIDITDKVLATKKLQEDKKRYKTYIEQSFEGIFCQELTTPVPLHLPFEVIMENIRNSYISECNDAMARMYGFQKAEELKGLLAGQMLDFEDPSNIKNIKAFVENDFKIISAESHEKDKEGNNKYFLNNLIGIVENGCLERIWGTQQDITGKKNIEKQVLLLAKLVEQTSDILTAADVNFSPVTWNKAAEKIYGLTAKQALGNQLSRFFTLDYMGFTRQQVRDIINKEGEWRGEASFNRPTDQKRTTLWMSFKQLKDEKCQLIGYLVSATDITERKEVESRLIESENRFREMADSAPVMIWMCDEKKSINYYNEKWKKLTGKDLSQGQPVWISMVHPNDVSATLSRYDEAFAKREKAVLFYRLLTEDGTYRWIQDVSVPRYLADGTFVGYIGSAVDIEDQKQKEMQLLYQATILENVTDIIITSDLDYNVKSWNKTAEFYYEKNAEEVIGKNIRDVLEFNIINSDWEQTTEYLSANKLWSGEIVVVRKDNQTYYFSYAVKYVYDENGHEIGVMAVGQNITQRKLADEKLKKSEQFYRTLISDSVDGILLMDKMGEVTFCSPSVKNVLGYEAEDIVGRNAFEYVHEDDLQWAEEAFNRKVEINSPLQFIIIRLLKKSGEWNWCMVRANNMLDNPDIKSVVVYFHDESFRKQANEALKESEKRFRNLVRDLETGVVMQDRNGIITLCNHYFAKLVGLTEDEIIGNNIKSIVTNPVHEDGSRFTNQERPFYLVSKNHGSARDVVMGIYRYGTKQRVWFIVNADPVYDDNGEILHIVCSVKDITERKKMEEDQLTKQIYHQKQLTQATIDGQEKERNEIGKELHDNIGQQLTTIKLFLDLAKSTADEATQEMVDMSLKGVSDVINEVRAMSRSLVPSTLKDLGLVESITELIETFSRTQYMQIEFFSSAFDEERIPENQKLTIFRILQEQLNNVVKHADAKHVFIELSSDTKGLKLQIIDNGKGFDPGKVKKGLGLVNMTNRAELFGGKIEIVSRPGNGCRFKLQLPVEYKEAGRTVEQ